MRMTIGRRLVPATSALLLALAGAGRGEPPKAGARPSAAAPLVDGQLSTGEWETSQEISFPENGPGSRTVVRAIWSREGLYFAMEARDHTPFTREPELGGSLHSQDVFEIFIDPTGDARQYYEVQIALSGATFFKNYVLTAEPDLGPKGELTEEFRTREWWPSVIPRPENVQTASRHDRDRGIWTAEVFLPASFLNRRRGGVPLQPGRLRVNFARHDWENREDAEFFYWAPVKHGHPHLSPTLMGFLQLEERP